MLTDAKCRSARPTDKPYKIFDGRGLYLYVATTGLRSWRWKYRIDGREKVLTIGNYPDVSLADARAAREAAAKAKRGGVDPSISKRAGPSSNFEDIARRWLTQQMRVWSASHARNVIASFEKEAFPTLGAKAISTVTAADILRVLEKMVDRGAVDQAHRLRQRLSDVFISAIALGMATDNPAEMLRKALPPIVKRNYPALVEIEDARALLIADAARSGYPVTKLASQLLAYTAVRSEALRYAEIHEFEDLGGAAPIWRIPAEKMKLGEEGRKVANLEHIVPLSRQSLEVIRVAAAFSRGAKYLFPTNRWPNRPMSENALSTRYRALPEFAGRHVPHGWRTTFSTIMNERAMAAENPGDRAVIDVMLAHQQEGVEPIYNRALYLPRRRQLAQEWADLLDVGLPTPAEILSAPIR